MLRRCEIKIDWKRVKTVIKFHLGMKCVVQYGDKWVVTLREVFIRSVYGRDQFKWVAMCQGHRDLYSKHWAKFDSQQEAQDFLEVVKLGKTTDKLKP